MLKRLRPSVSYLLLLALVFNALSPLIAAAQMRQGGLQTLAMCTAGGLQSVTLSSDGKILPGAPVKTPCPFCLLSACGPALTAALPVFTSLGQPSHLSPIFTAVQPLRTAPNLLPPTRGPPALA
ncbi:MAG: DUF2946 family protein [Stenotrophobium sp.]